MPYLNNSGIITTPILNHSDVTTPPLLCGENHSDVTTPPLGRQGGMEWSPLTVPLRADKVTPLSAVMVGVHVSVDTHALALVLDGARSTGDGLACKHPSLD